MNMKLLSCVVAAAMSAAGASHAENLNYKFGSPAFGGNPNNGTYFFGIAQAQQTATDRDPSVGIGGGGGGGSVSGGGNIGGPTIIIPINSNQPDAPATDVNTEARVRQVPN